MSVQQGYELRDKALARVEANAPKKWMEKAERELLQLLQNRVFISTDELWKVLDAPPEPRAMGAVMRKAQKNGWIRPSDQYKPSNRPKCHGRPVRIWINTLESRHETAN